MRETVKIWRDVLAHVVSRKAATFTVAAVAGELDLDYASAGQVVGRLRQWGHVRLVGFEDPASTRENPSGRGRRRNVFEVTDHGRRAAEYHRKQSARR